LVRLRRNDASWANKTTDANISDLLVCWGIGPSKVQLDPEPGFGHELLAELSADACVEKLEVSWRFGSGEIVSTFG
jgi:hypothetical protein